MNGNVNLDLISQPADIHRANAFKALYEEREGSEY